MTQSPRVSGVEVVLCQGVIAASLSLLHARRAACRKPRRMRFPPQRLSWDPL